MSVYRATSDDRYLEKATHIARTLFPVFMDSDDGVLREYFTEELRVDGDRNEIEPGHMFEWVWLLNTYETFARHDTSDDRNALYARAEQLGPDPKFHGFVSNEVDIAAPGARGPKRLWPQLEYLRASCVQAREGNAHAEDMIPALINAIFETYLKTDVEGLWVDEFDERGAPIAQAVPASILYHLFEAVLESQHFTNGVSHS
jgi:mannose-6-phosphate isomerase